MPTMWALLALVGTLGGALGSQVLLEKVTNVHCFLLNDLTNSSDEQHCQNVRSSSFWCLMAAGLVVTAGVAPALFLPRRQEEEEKEEEDNCRSSSVKGTLGDSRCLNRFLSFAVGTLLGDVFLHLLPNLWSTSDNPKLTGLWTLGGLMCCVCVEKCAQQNEHSKCLLTAVLNLLANVVDNFCHGLAIGTSFMVDRRFGLLTTFAILLHEVPHEIGDFALLLRAKLSRRSAVAAQLLTALFGIVGSLTAVLVQNAQELNQGAACWMLPFCAGSFLNIALIQVLPDILSDIDPKESLWHALLILFGIGVTGSLAAIHLKEEFVATA